MNRRTFLKSTAATTALISTRHVWSAETTSTPDDDLLALAKERIERHRKGDGVIAVRNADGKPVPGATVKLDQVRHQFLFGCNFFVFDRVGDPERERQYRERFSALLNYATLGFYWPMYEPERGKPIYDYTDKVLDWCRQQGIRCKGHPLVWDFADPRWLPRDFGEIRELSHARVRDCVSRFKGRLDTWDVVNEPTHLGRFGTRLGEWAMSVGAVPYVAEHLKIARDANPQATLLVNDYRTDPAYYQILDALRADGKLSFNVIGIQSHMHDGPWPLSKVWEVCERFAKLGLPLHFTETTVVSGPRLGNGERWGPTTPELEAKQADAVERFYRVLFSQPAVQGLTWWDFSDFRAWQGAAAGLVRRDMTPKPAYDRLHAMIKGEWWTKTQGQTNNRGEFATSAFFGTHRVAVELPNGRKLEKEVNWQRGGVNRFDLVIG